MDSTTSLASSSWLQARFLSQVPFLQQHTSRAPSPDRSWCIQSSPTSRRLHLLSTRICPLFQTHKSIPKSAHCPFLYKTQCKGELNPSVASIIWGVFSSSPQLGAFDIAATHAVYQLSSFQLRLSFNATAGIFCTATEAIFVGRNDPNIPVEISKTDTSECPHSARIVELVNSGSEPQMGFIHIR